MKRLWFQRFLIFLEMAPRMVKGGPDWWAQIKACWAEAERVHLRQLYGQFESFFERFRAAAMQFSRAGVTVAEAIWGVKVAFGKFAPMVEEAWRESCQRETKESGASQTPIGD